jgi:hypothetical protein
MRLEDDLFVLVMIARKKPLAGLRLTGAHEGRRRFRKERVE